jgi:hypothetical protein
MQRQQESKIVRLNYQCCTKKTTRSRESLLRSVALVSAIIIALSLSRQIFEESEEGQFTLNIVVSVACFGKSGSIRHQQDQILPECKQSGTEPMINNPPNVASRQKLRRKFAGFFAAACVVLSGLFGVVEFSNNVIDLSDKLGFPLEFVQPRNK